jgi:ABC-type uncharacterized transport system permease subunit
MLWYVVAFVVSIIIGLLAKRFCWRGDFFSGFFISMLITSILATILAFVIGHNLMFNVGRYNKKLDEKNLYSISDSLTVNGAFFLASGVVSGDLLYYYVTEDTYGYRVHSVGAKKAFVKFSDETPNIKIYTFSLKNKLWGFCLDQYNFIITIPEGSITEKFSIDLQ